MSFAQLKIAGLAAVLVGCAYPEFQFRATEDAPVAPDTEPVDAEVNDTSDTTMELDSTLADTSVADAALDSTDSRVGDADASSDSVVADTAMDARPPTFVTLLAKGASWKYLDDGTAPSSINWRGGSSFDDTKWKSGLAELGFGDGDEKTVIGSPWDPDAGVDAGPFVVSYYFRRVITVTGASAYDQLTVRVNRDDGAVVYLNGTELFRSNMPGGTIGNGTFAASNISGVDENVFVTHTVSTTALKEGTNVFAVEIHQAYVGSSDVSFDLEVVGRKP